MVIVGSGRGDNDELLSSLVGDVEFPSGRLVGEEGVSGRWGKKSWVKGFWCDHKISFLFEFFGSVDGW